MQRKIEGMPKEKDIHIDPERGVRFGKVGDYWASFTPRQAQMLAATILSTWPDEALDPRDAGLVVTMRDELRRLLNGMNEFGKTRDVTGDSQRIEAVILRADEVIRLMPGRENADADEAYEGSKLTGDHAREAEDDAKTLAVNMLMEALIDEVMPAGELVRIVQSIRNVIVDGDSLRPSRLPSYDALVSELTVMLFEGDEEVDSVVARSEDGRAMPDLSICENCGALNGVLPDGECRECHHIQKWEVEGKGPPADGGFSLIAGAAARQQAKTIRQDRGEESDGDR